MDPIARGAKINLWKHDENRAIALSKLEWDDEDAQTEELFYRGGRAGAESGYDTAVQSSGFIQARFRGIHMSSFEKICPSMRNGKLVLKRSRSLGSMTQRGISSTGRLPPIFNLSFKERIFNPGSVSGRPDGQRVGIYLGPGNDARNIVREPNRICPGSLEDVMCRVLAGECFPGGIRSAEFRPASDVTLMFPRVITAAAQIAHTLCVRDGFASVAPPTQPAHNRRKPSKRAVNVGLTPSWSPTGGTKERKGSQRRVELSCQVFKYLNQL
ncbi:hypothetical protein C8R44DRAFT_859015 [Mycena epipterygia]|nr:hypothetical protein C8R44DRAFT_859015 [Mycena epipterygia]